MYAGYQLKFYKNHEITQDEMDRAIDRAIWGINIYLERNPKLFVGWKTNGFDSIETSGYSTPEMEVIELYTSGSK